MALTKDPRMNAPADASAPQIADVALRLRKVKEAYRSFLSLWAAECMAEESPAMQHLADDMDNQLTGDATERELANPFNYNWTFLYRGSVLDD